eukprot:TRINITY_DN190_c0_g3_i1.p1 TRINITY_DN190_c0_g3~~TRINITY_DN190_c0_g3_i1.p1  ORF type:complete len:296 (+),score=110.70 TRINITY_DN190_c0_g3_i1:162-1049(+)
MNFLWYFGGTVLTLGTSFLAALYFFQEKLIYVPSFPPGSSGLLKYDETPRNYGLNNYLDLYTTTQDKIKLHYWLILQSNSNNCPTILYFHGNAGNIAHRIPYAQMMYDKLKVNVVLATYRGYGVNKGSPSERGFKLDSQAVLDDLITRSEIDNKKILLFGTSIGGAVALNLAATNPNKITGLILENTFTHLEDMIDVVFPILKKFKPFLRNKWPNRDLINTIDVPILFISGRADELVPPYMMDRLAQLAKPELSQMICVDGGTHNETILLSRKWIFTPIDTFVSTAVERAQNLSK